MGKQIIILFICVAGFVQAQNYHEEFYLTGFKIDKSIFYIGKTVFVKNAKPNTLSLLDSAIYYFSKAQQMRSTKTDLEIKYFQTGKDKYRVLGNKYIDSSEIYSLDYQ